MSLLPPYGWIHRSEPSRSLLVGFDFSPAWPIFVLAAFGLFGLGWPTLMSSLAVWASTAAAAAGLSLLRGFRLEVSPRGFILWRTWAGLPYWRVRLPLSARVEVAGGLGDPPDRVVIESRLYAEDIVVGCSSTCDDLCVALRSAQKRWRQ